MNFSITVDIAAPPERVWSVMSDIERWAEWTTSVKSIKRLDHGPLAPGSRAVIRQPRLLPAMWKVTALQPGRSFTWTTGSPGVRVIAHHLVEPTGHGSRATLSLQFGGLLGPLVARITSGLNNRYLSLEAAGLKRRSEGHEDR